MLRQRFVLAGQSRGGLIEPRAGAGVGLPTVHEPDANHLDMVPSATGGITRLAYARAEEEGIEVESLLQKAGLTRRQIDDPGARIRVQGQIKFLEFAAKSLRDDLLGFHLAQKFDLREIGLLYYVLASSHMLGEALQRGVRYSAIANEGIALRLREGKDVGIIFDYVGVARHSDRHQIEFWMAAVVRVCRQLAGRRLPASRVSLTHPRSGDTSELSAFFGIDVVFGAAIDEVTFPLSIKQMPVVGADPYLNGLLIQYCEEALAGSATSRSSFGLSVENAIALLLPHGKARAGEVARKLGVSQRTLARRLAAEGLTFAGVLQSLRSDLARRHLTDDSLSISKIAWLLGYQDVSAFTHAFKRWNGRTPRAARERSQ
jgi:AraC-like DNA-binding protein